MSVQQSVHLISLVDLGVVTCVNLFNLLLAALFLGRVTNQPLIARVAGIGSLLLGIPLAVFAVANFVQRRPWWTVVLPLLLVLFTLITYFMQVALGVYARYKTGL